jgi:hypothetical protein
MRDQLAVDFDLLPVRIDLGAEFRDDFAVHAHPTLGDHLFGAAS